jgi:hypothetical protein
MIQFSVIKMEFKEIKHLTDDQSDTKGALRVFLVGNHKQKSNKQVQDEHNLLIESVKVARFAAICAALAAVGSVVTAVKGRQQHTTNTDTHRRNSPTGIS